MNKKLTKLVSLLSIGLVGGTMFLPSVQVFANENQPGFQALDVEPYTPEAIAQYEKTQELITIAIETKELKDIRNAYEAFIKMTPHMNVQNYNAYTPDDQMDHLYFLMRDVIYELTPKKNLKSEILRFAKKWKKVLMENTNSLYTYHFRYFVMENDIKSLNKALSDLESDLNRYVNGIPTQDGIIPLPTNDEMQKIVEEFFKHYGSDKPDPKAPTDKETEDDLKNRFPQSGGQDVAGQTIRYEQIGGVWYEIIETVVDGEVIKTNKRQLSKDESYRFLIQQNPLYDPYNTVSQVSYITERQWKHYTSDQNPKSKYTIHYTVNKDETTPYYYDTGIRVNKNKAATYEQYKDVLLVIVDKIGGHLVEDKGKILVVLEGKPIVVFDSKEYYSKQELEFLFSEFEKVDIRIMETSIGKAGSLEEQIVSKQARSVLVDEKEIALDTFPMVKNERALLPLEEIAYALGGTVSSSDSSYTASKSGNNVIFRLKDNNVYVNGKPIAMKNPPIVRDNALMVEVNELATSFGYSMVWDSETSTINFESR